MTSFRYFLLLIVPLEGCVDTPKPGHGCENTSGILTDDGVAHDTISDAARAAGPGGTVTVCPGVYATDYVTLE